MATKQRVVKKPPVEGKVTLKQARAAVEAVMKNKELLTNEQLEEFKGSWEAMYNDPAFNKQQVLNNILVLTDRILVGDVVVEKA